MPDDDALSETARQDVPSRSTTAQRPANRWADIFALPAPLKELFSRFPLVSYAANELPARSPRHQGKHALHVFAFPDGHGLSYNPTCLKWQTYLRLRGIDFVPVPSNNHAAPTGSLPFLILPPPPSAAAAAAPKSGSDKGKTTSTASAAVPATKLRGWADEHASTPGPKSAPSRARQDVYLSLIDHGLRRAWLYQLYIHPANRHLLTSLYAAPFSSSPLVRYPTLRALRAAAADELRKSNPVAEVAEEEILREGAEALVALDELLSSSSSSSSSWADGSEGWFFGAQGPGVLDAAVFAYTHLLLWWEEDGIGGRAGWGWNPLGAVVKGRTGLVRHRERVLKEAYGG